MVELNCRDILSKARLAVELSISSIEEYLKERKSLISTTHEKRSKIWACSMKTEKSTTATAITSHAFSIGCSVSTVIAKTPCSPITPTFLINASHTQTPPALSMKAYRTSKPCQSSWPANQKSYT